MHLRAFAAVLFLLVGTVTAAFADLEVTKARYGTPTNFRDVRGIVSAYVRNNTLSFPVNARSMGGDPNPRQTDYLWIVYELNGHEFTESVQEGGIFTFKVPGVKAVHPLLNLPLLKPPAPQTAELVVANGTRSGVRVYSVDRYGQWIWVANLFKGESITVKGQLGQEWIATDHAGRILGRDKIARKENRLWVTEPGGHSPAGGFRGGADVWVRFENPGARPLYLYNLDAAGRWNWTATIEPHGVHPASTRVGETWIATDTANRIVRQVIVAPGMSLVPLD